MSPTQTLRRLAVPSRAAQVPAHLATPEDDAAAVLAQTWPPLDADEAVPVDPVVIGRHLGIDVCAGRVRRGIGEVSLTPGRPALLGIDLGVPPGAMAFTYAHLLGHYVARVSAGETSFTIRDGWRELTFEPDAEERYANRFAEALMMPREAVEPVARMKPPLLAARFDVPPDVMLRRLVALDLR